MLAVARDSGQRFEMARGQDDGWYIVFTMPQKEAFVAESLRHAGYETVFLHERAILATGREIKRPRWPRYVLVRPQEGQGLYEAAWHQGVCRFVSAAGEPCRLAHGFIEGLLSEADEHGCLGWEEAPSDKRTERVNPDDVLRILTGPFTGLHAVVRLDTGRKIWADCEGLPVELRPGDVKLVRPGRAAR